MKNLSALIVLNLLIILLSQFLPFAPIVSYAASKIISSILFVLIVLALFKTNISRNAVFGFVFLYLVLRLININSLPLGSDDIYRYIWDGKVQASAINPYLYAPDAKELQHLNTQILPALVNHSDMQTMYFPLSEWIFYSGYMISHENVWGYKLLLFISEFFTIFGLYLLLQKRGKDIKFLLLYALCPLLIYEYSIDGHVDVFGLTFLVFFLYFYLEKKFILSLIFLGCSFSIKPAAFIVIPILFFFTNNWKQRFIVIIVPIATLAIQFFPYIFSSDPFVSLYAFTKHWTFNGFIFNVVNLYFENNQPARITCGILLIIIIFIISLKHYSLFDKIYYGFLLLLLFSPIVHPWYIGWAAIFNPLMKRWSGLYYSASASLTAYTVMNYQLYGIWKDYWFILLLEYIPVLIFIFFELKNLSSTTPNNYSKEVVF